MTHSCRHISRNPTQRQICKEELRRFQMTPKEIQKEGGVMAVAVAKADQEYQASLSAASLERWVPPRHHPKSFVRFLDQKGFTISWYMEEARHIGDIQRVQAVQCDMHACDARALLRGLADLWLGDWGIQFASNLRVEKKVDHVIDAKTARCSEWTSVQMASALIVHQDIEVVFNIRPTGAHIEPYWVLGGELYWSQVLDGPVRKLPQVGEVTQSAIPRADAALIYSINTIVTTPQAPAEKYRQIQSLQVFVGDERLKAWMEIVLGEYARDSGRLELADRHFNRARQYYPPAINRIVGRD